jgi:nucleotide-binding universal stress UspA family protein
MIMPIRKILVAVDGSNPSFKASAHAIDLAKNFKAELIALHIIYPVYIPYEIALSQRTVRLEEVTRKEMEQGKKHVDKVKQKAVEKKVRVKTDVVIGVTSVVKDIVDYAEKKKIDMIVIGSRGMTGFKKLWLGSVAGGVVTYSHCPVLVVK